MAEYLRINFRGTTVQVSEEVMKSLPMKSKFSDQVTKQCDAPLCDVLQCTSCESIIYLNRSASLFDHILDYIENGELHYPHNICSGVIFKELEFWGYTAKDLASCCLDRILEERENIHTYEVIAKGWNHLKECNTPKHDRYIDTKNGIHGRKISMNNLKDQQSIKRDSTVSDQSKYYNVSYLPEEGCIIQCSEEDTDHDQMHGCRVTKPQRGRRRGRSETILKLHKILLDPLSSIQGKVWMGIIISVIGLSMLSLLLECEPRLRMPSYAEVIQHTNLTIGEGIYTYYFYHSVPYSWITYLDVACVTVLTIDFVARWFVSQNRCRFLVYPMSIVDMLGILPVWILFGFTLYAQAEEWTIEQWYNSTFIDLIIVVIILRLFRLFRFRLILTNFKSLRVIALAYKNSFKELCILSTLLAMFSVIYGVLMFYIEIQSQDTFPSGFHAQWWAFITMTTVGYGDFVPKTDMGYVVAVLCALCGIVVVAMTTTIIINNFLKIYSNVEKFERKNKFLESLHQRESTADTETRSSVY